MAACNLCDLLSTGEKDGTAISEEEKVDHAKFHLKQNKFIDDGDQRTLEEILGSCFGEKISVKNGGGEESTDRSHRQTFHAHCRQLFGYRPKFPRVACNLCDTEIKVVNGRGLNSTAIIYHASTHLVVKLFECGHCNQRFTGKFGVVSHVKRVHRVKKPTDEDFIDRSIEFHDQLVDMIKNCFVGCKQATMSDEDRKSFKAVNIIRGRIGASAFASKRHLLCHRLVHEGVDDTVGKIECHVCSKWIVVKTAGSITTRVALFHMERHLKKPIYRCNQCDKPSATYPLMREHLRTKHAMTMGNNYEDNSDKYHEEIIASLSKCFEGKTPSAQSESKTKRRRPKVVEKVAPIHRGNAIGSASSSGIRKSVKTAAASSTTQDQHRRTTATNSSATSPLASTDSLEKRKSEQGTHKRAFDDSNHVRGSIDNGSSPISAQSIAIPSKKAAATQTETDGPSINPFDEW